VLQGGFNLKKLTALLIGLLLTFSAATAVLAQDTVHVVKKGDTLWDITRHYLHNPWKWPVVWSNNEDITNPHLIYPGDRVILSKKDGKTTITIIPAKGGAPLVYSTVDAAGVKGKTFMVAPEYSTYIYNATPLTGVGTVVKKVEQGELIARSEGILIKSTSALTSGSIVSIASKITEVKDKDQIKGYLYRVVGYARVQQHEGILYKAMVLDTNQEMRLGDVVLEGVQNSQPMKVTLYEPSLKSGSMVMDLYGGTVHGSSYLDLIFLNVGKKDGVDKGALVSIYKELTVEGVSDKVPDYRGNALVLQALEESSVALVTESLVPINRDFVLTGPK
jgi:hypothetical protein